MPVLARPCSPAAIFGWCDLLPKTFDLFGFLPLSTITDFSGGKLPTWGGGLYDPPCIFELYFRDICQLQQDILDMTGL